MKTTEELTKELDEVTNKVFEKAKDFSLSLQSDFANIDLGEITTEEEEIQKKSFYGAVAMRQQAILKRLLIDWGGLLFM